MAHETGIEWFGWSAENQARFDERTPVELQVPAAVHFVSLEPLLGPIDFSGYEPMTKWIDWVIVGCESGPNRRPCDIQWVADIVRQCRESAVPVFIKQIIIAGKVEKDPAKIAHAVSLHLGRSVTAEDIRQWPKGHNNERNGR